LILLIEDNTMIRENIEEVLTLEGYKVVTADSGRTGVEMAEKLKPDLMICDIIMKGLDGYEVFTELNKNPKTSNIPVIFSTSRSENCDKEKAIALGVKYYLVKPFGVPELMACIASCLQSTYKN
jgi:DNA-binding response OmpR family regulator